jgi:hypothetical protein
VVTLYVVYPMMAPCRTGRNTHLTTVTATTAPFLTKMLNYPDPHYLRKRLRSKRRTYDYNGFEPQTVTQVGYYVKGDWVVLTELTRVYIAGAKVYKSDTYPGAYDTVSEWKDHIVSLATNLNIQDAENERSR